MGGVLGWCGVVVVVADLWVSALCRKPLPGVKSGTEVTAEALEAVGVLHDEGLVKAVLTDLVALAEGAELEPHTRPKGERGGSLGVWVGLTHAAPAIKLVGAEWTVESGMLNTHLKKVSVELGVGVGVVWDETLTGERCGCDVCVFRCTTRLLPTIARR